MRGRFFTPRIRLKSYDELNAWLLDQTIAYAKAHRHPELKDRTIWQAFEAERASLVPYPGRFDGFHAVPASVSKTCLVRIDNNRYSVAASAVGRPVEVRAYAERIEIRQDGRVVGEHPRSFGRDRTISNPWHYVPVLARKPGALRNGAPFKAPPAPPGAVSFGDRIDRLLTIDGCCPPGSSACAASSRARPTATASSSTSSPPCSATDCRRLRRPARRPWTKVSTRRT